MMLLSLGEVVVTVYPPHLVAKAYESEEVGQSRIHHQLAVLQPAGYVYYRRCPNQSLTCGPIPSNNTGTL